MRLLQPAREKCPSKAYGRSRSSCAPWLCARDTARAFVGCRSTSRHRFTYVGRCGILDVTVACDDTRNALWQACGGVGCVVSSRDVGFGKASMQDTLIRALFHGLCCSFKPSPAISNPHPASLEPSLRTFRRTHLPAPSGLKRARRNAVI